MELDLQVHKIARDVEAIFLPDRLEALQLAQPLDTLPTHSPARHARAQQLHDVVDVPPSLLVAVARTPQFQAVHAQCLDVALVHPRGCHQAVMAGRRGCDPRVSAQR